MESSFNQDSMFNLWALDNKYQYELGKVINYVLEIDPNRLIIASNKDILEATFHTGNKSMFKS